MTIKETHDFIQFVLNKETGGYVTPSEIDMALDRAQMEKFTELFGKVQEYQPGRPIPRVAYGVTMRVHEDLSPFKRSFSLTTTAGEGKVSLTGISVANEALDILHVVSMDINYEGNPYGVKFLTESEVANRRRSFINPPSESNPIGVVSKDSIQLYPLDRALATTTNVLVRPKKPLFSFTQEGRVITHDPATSQDLEWREDAVNDVISRALRYLGVNLSDVEVSSFAGQKTVEGA